MDRRPEAAGGGAQAVPGEGQAAIRAHRLGRPARGVAREGGDGAGVPRRAHIRLQHQRRNHDARFRERAHVRLVHARRRHGPAGNDRLAEPHHRARSRDLPRAAMGARRTAEGGVGWILADEYFNTGIPFHFSPRHLLRKQLARLQGAQLGARRRSRGRVVPDARRAGASSTTTTSARPAYAAIRSRRRRSSPAIPTTPNPTWT